MCTFILMPSETNELLINSKIDKENRVMAKEVTLEQIEMIEEMVARAHVAADVIATYDQERVDKLCQAVAAALYDMKTWAQMADEAVDETGLGDKVTKRNKRNKI